VTERVARTKDQGQWVDFYWGSAEGMSGTALQALWYEDLTGDSTYRDVASRQRD
jgi:hypothetical protein